MTFCELILHRFVSFLKHGPSCFSFSSELCSSFIGRTASFYLSALFIESFLKRPFFQLTPNFFCQMIRFADWNFPIFHPAFCFCLVFFGKLLYKTLLCEKMEMVISWLLSLLVTNYALDLRLEGLIWCESCQVRSSSMLSLKLLKYWMMMSFFLMS